MPRILLQIAALAALIILQSSFGESIFVFRSFNLMLLVVIFTSAVATWPVALLTAAVSGLAVDSISYAPTGLYLMAAISVFLLIRALVKYMFTSLSLLSVAAISVIATIFYWLVIMLFSRLLAAADLVSYRPFFYPSMLKLIGIQLIVHALLAGFAFFLSSRLSRRFNLAFLKK